MGTPRPHLIAYSGVEKNVMYVTTTSSLVQIQHNMAMLSFPLKILQLYLSILILE